jgi:hypothetical protein
MKVLPEAQRKPTYLMEFGIRGANTLHREAKHSRISTTPPTAPRSGGRTSRAFQQLWFNIGSAQLGFTGTSKWDALLGTVRPQ